MIYTQSQLKYILSEIRNDRLSCPVLIADGVIVEDCTYKTIDFKINGIRYSAVTPKDLQHLLLTSAEFRDWYTKPKRNELRVHATTEMEYESGKEWILKEFEEYKAKLREMNKHKRLSEILAEKQEEDKAKPITNEFLEYMQSQSKSKRDFSKWFWRWYRVHCGGSYKLFKYSDLTQHDVRVAYKEHLKNSTEEVTIDQTIFNQYAYFEDDLACAVGIPKSKLFGIEDDHCMDSLRYAVNTLGEIVDTKVFVEACKADIEKTAYEFITKNKKGEKEMIVYNTVTEKKDVEVKEIDINRSVKSVITHIIEEMEKPDRERFIKHIIYDVMTETQLEQLLNQLYYDTFEKDVYNFYGATKNFIDTIYKAYKERQKAENKALSEMQKKLMEISNKSIDTVTEE